MKSRIFSILAVFACAGFLTSCNEEKQFEGELYKKVIYLLSNEDYSFQTEHALGEESEGYVTVYCGGTEHIKEDVKVVLEPYQDVLDEYNHILFDLDESRYARLLDPSHYTISSYETTLKASSADNYALLPIKIRPDGLCPDSTYMIPLRIKSVSNFEVNPKKEVVLYQVLLKNAYATTKTVTYYQMTGTETVHMKSGDVASGISVTRVVAPLLKNQVRMFVGTHSYTPSAVAKEEIAKYAMTITVNADNSLKITPYGDVEVEMIDDPESNVLTVDKKGNYVFKLHYRFKDTVTLSGVTETCWVTMNETNVQRKATNN
ncbi:MAG: DUF4361 domain-containing protein [Bacteroidales bacterium]|nr:DUF4361 domain-containing protein [Bacteroidales bacterium]